MSTVEERAVVMVAQASNTMSKWWRQPDHYDWFSSYLQARRITGIVRLMVAGAAVSLGIIPLAMIVSHNPPTYPVGVVLAVLSGAAAFGGALIFVLGWPNRRRSIAFVLTSNAAIALSSLAQSQPNAAMLACAAFAVIAGYIALWHTAMLLTYNFVVAVIVGAAAAAKMAAIQGIVHALCAFAVVVILNVSAPLGIQMLVHALGVDLLRADRDPLTGLLTRRAFYRTANRIAETHPIDGEYLFVAMIDLDRFKQLNDGHGHSVGDDALMALGRSLRDNVSPSAVLGRVGGEEFLVVDVLDTARPTDLGKNICELIAALPYPITASVGTATIGRAERRGLDGGQTIAALVAEADAAMYEAKRDGGDQTRHRYVTV